MRHFIFRGEVLFLFSWLLALSGTALGESRLIFPDLTQNAAAEMGFAVFNPMGSPTKATFTAFSETGALIKGEGITNPVTLDLPANAQIARFGRDNLPVNLQLRAWMEVKSDSDELKGFFLTLENGLARVDGDRFTVAPVEHDCSKSSTACKGTAQRSRV